MAPGIVSTFVGRARLLLSSPGIVQAEAPCWRLLQSDERVDLDLRLAPDAVMIAIDSMRIGANDFKVGVGNLGAIEIGRAW